jgi:hypothetical protein
MLGDRKATTKLGMGMTEISPRVAVARLLADTLVIAKNRTAFGLFFLVAGRHRTTPHN